MKLPPAAQSMGRYLFDLETDGLLAEVSRVHCAVAIDLDTEEVHDFKPHEIGKFLELYANATQLVGHNIIGFDIQVIAKLYGVRPNLSCEIIDTLTLARLVFSDIKQTDFPLAKAWKKYKLALEQNGHVPGRPPQEFPGQFVGLHSLEAWGYRLGAERKGDYSKEMKAQGLDPWASWNEAMHAYMLQDGVVNLALFRHLMAQGPTPQSIALEMAVQFLCERMSRNGWPLDLPKAQELYQRLSQRRHELEVLLAEAFPPWEVRLEDFIPKRANKTKGYVAGVPVERWETREFNPSSRDHIADRLTAKYGWKPIEFTDGGSPKVDDDVLQALPYPEAKLLAEYFLIQKRIGQLGEGSQAWLKQVSKRGRIHARYNTNGAFTGRATHSNPNIAQVPSVGAEYGWDCRVLFTVPRGWTQLGADQSGLELRCLGSFMAAFDGGSYREIVLGPDIHWVNAKALFDLPDDTVRATEEDHPDYKLHKKYRDVAKTFIYAFLYGAGPEKLGSIPGVTPEEEKLWLSDPKHRNALIAIRDRAARRKIKLTRKQLLLIYKGEQLQAAFLRKFPALKKLVKYVKEAAGKGWIKGLDGRVLPVRSDHAALNTLLQSAGALICKSWIALAEQAIVDAGFKISEGIGEDWDADADVVFMGWIHDEVAVAVRNPQHVDRISQLIIEAGRKAGDPFPSWKCPTDVEVKVGYSWAETH